MRYEVIDILLKKSKIYLPYIIFYQVNLKSCCVVPEELSSFVKEKGVTLLTHSDPSELLPGDSLR